MTHYVTLTGGRIDLTMVLDSLMLPNQIDALQYINITPMPNSMTATGSFEVLTAAFSNEALVTYEADTSIMIDEFNEIGSVFTIDEQTKTISWLQGSGYKNLTHRMNGSYSDGSGLSYQYLNFEATVVVDTTIEFNIVGTRYSVVLTPDKTSYQVDLTMPTSGTADLWKFKTGFNLGLTIDTSVAGQIVFGSMTLSN